MRYRVLLLALSYALCGPVRSGAQEGPALKAPPPEASQFDFLVGEWTVDVTSKAPGTPPQYHGVWRAAKTLNGLGIVMSTPSLTTPAASCMQGPRCACSTRKPPPGPCATWTSSAGKQAVGRSWWA